MGFLFGAILSFVTFAAGDPEEEANRVVLKRVPVTLENKSNFGPTAGPAKVFRYLLNVFVPSLFKIKPSEESDHLFYKR